MRLGVASNIVLDEITSPDGAAVWDLGGPPCYCGLTARRFKFEVSIATKVGDDFSEEYVQFLKKSGLQMAKFRATGGKTTSFKLHYDVNGERELYLKANCTKITLQDIDGLKVDGWLVSPVYDEVPIPTLEGIMKSKNANGGLIMLDPQGYLRHADPEGRVALLSNSDIDLSGIDIVKADEIELGLLTGGLGGFEGMKSLVSKGVRAVLATEHRKVTLLHGDTLYWLKLREINTPDSTGAGDILTSAFICALLKEDDPLWALCFGTGALSAALESGKKGIAKIPEISRIEQNASYFYNSVSFKKL